MYTDADVSLLDPPKADPTPGDAAARSGRMARAMRRRQRKTNRATVAALDLGTTKICALIGYMDEEGHVRLKGMGQAPSAGFRRGMVADIEASIDSIRSAVEQAEAEAGESIRDVYVGIAGGHISCLNGTGMIEVANPTRGVTSSERGRVLERARAVSIPEGREIIHVIPQEFICDEQRGVKNPVGMSCRTLQARVHLVTAAVTSAQNIVRCVHRAGLRMSDMLLESLASSMSILTDDEKQLGVLLIDMGGGTSDVALFQDGAVRFSGVVPFAGNAVTADVAQALQLSRLDAELVKHGSGTAQSEAINPSELLELHAMLSGDSRKASRRFLAEVVEARCIEILEGAREMVEKAGYDECYPGGVVLTGGTALVDGIGELAEEIFGCDIRLGMPPELDGRTPCPSSPIYATAQGLLLYGIAREQNPEGNQRRPGFMGRVYHKFLRMIDWYV